MTIRPGNNNKSANVNASISEFHQLVRNFGGTASRPSTDLALYQTYFNVDVPAWQYWDGSTWQTLSTGGGGLTITTVQSPLIYSGTTLSIAITAAADGGAVALQASYPGTAQTGNGHVTGTIGADTRFNLNTIPMLERGGTFPTTSLVDGQRYYHTTYRAWFTYNSTDAKWRQEAPGVFSGSFPTVSSGDNTVAPKIKVYRLDRNLEYYWDGTRWLSTVKIWMVLTSRGAVMPFAQGTTFFDAVLGGKSTGTGVYITDLACEARFISVVQSATNYYTISLVGSNGTTTTTIPLSGTTNTQTFGTNHQEFTPTVTPTVLDTTYFLMEATMTPTNNPGTFIFFGSIGYQLIG